MDDTVDRTVGEDSPPGTARKVFPGVALAAAIAVAADSISRLPFAPFTLPGKDGRPVHPVEAVLLAILLGLLINNLVKLPKSIAPGASYCLKSVLALGIVLMGSKLNFFEVMKLGGLSAGLVVIVIAVALTVSTRFARILNLEAKLGALIAIGCTICGGSAIAATAPAIEAEDKDVAFAVGTITILGVAAMFLYPVISNATGLTDVGFGIWAGTSIHNTPQVVAAGIMRSPVSGDVATAVKMIRNLFIAPVVILFGFLFRNRRASGMPVKLNYKELFPLFVLGFLLMALFRTSMANLGMVGTARDPRALWPLFRFLEDASVWIIIVAMAGIGLTTNLRDMRKLGFRPFLGGLITTVIVAAVSLALIFAFHLNDLAIAK
jgi:uncharacterized integral membrane protein (TIGR00698 family)